MTLSHIVTILSVIGFLITAAGLIGVSFRVGRNAQTVANYRDSADAWETKAKAQAELIADLETKLAANDALTKKLQDRVKVLEGLITGEAAITSLAAKLDTSFGDMQTHIDLVAEKIRNDIRGQHQ